MESSKRISVKDIARGMNVSLSTVNKALTNKKGVSEARRAEIIEYANQLGYKVNKVAQSLARNEIRIGIIISNDWAPFYKLMEKGLSEEIKKLNDYNVSGIMKYFYHSSDVIQTIQNHIKELLNQNVQAIVLTPIEGDYTNILKLINKKKVPLVLLGSDITSYGERLLRVRINANMSGRIAAEVTRLFLQPQKSAAVFIGNKDLEVHKEKVQGFYDESGREPAIPVIGVFETQDDPDLAYVLTRKLLNEKPDLGAIYVATANSASVCKCIEEHGFIGKVKVIATDIYEEQSKYMQEGIIAAAIDQNTELQGKLAVRSVYSYLSEGKLSDNEILVAPIIVLRNNMAQFL